MVICSTCGKPKQIYCKVCGGLKTRDSMPDYGMKADDPNHKCARQKNSAFRKKEKRWMTNEEFSSALAECSSDKSDIKEEQSYTADEMKQIKEREARDEYTASAEYGEKYTGCDNMNCLEGGEVLISRTSVCKRCGDKTCSTCRKDNKRKYFCEDCDEDYQGYVDSGYTTKEIKEVFWDY